MVPIALMVAMASNRCIGQDNALPWHLPEDLKHFKKTTTAKPIIMGRKTYDSIGRPLPGRQNIVITRSDSWSAKGVTAVTGLQLALDAAQKAAVTMNADEIICIGGAQIYGAMLPMVSRMYLTRVDAVVDGDAFFPEYNGDDWTCISKVQYKSNESNPYDYTFECWDKK